MQPGVCKKRDFRVRVLVWPAQKDKILNFFFQKIENPRTLKWTICENEHIFPNTANPSAI